MVDHFWVERAPTPQRSVSLQVYPGRLCRMRFYLLWYGWLGFFCGYSHRAHVSFVWFCSIGVNVSSSSRDWSRPPCKSLAFLCMFDVAYSADLRRSSWTASSAFQFGPPGSPSGTHVLIAILEKVAFFRLVFFSERQQRAVHLTSMWPCSSSSSMTYSSMLALGASTCIRDKDLSHCGVLDGRCDGAPVVRG